MKTRTAALLSLALTAGVLTACSKPAAQSAANAETSAGAAVSTEANAATDGAMSPGGTVSPPNAPQNDAVNADTNKGDTSQTPGSNSFTEGQAKGHIENAGYTDVTGLTKTPDGLWTGSAKKDGKTVQVSVDFKGAVSAK
jgi:hypothetical protein